MKISLIAALDKNNIIGNKGEIPWSFKEDFKYFKEKTLNSPVIMGRKTYESIGKPLPHRINMVLSSDETYKPHEDVLVVSSPKKALSLCIGSDEVFICGGSKIYEEFMPLADNMYLTHIDGQFEGDIYFPNFFIGEECGDWQMVCGEGIMDIDRNTGKNYGLGFIRYSRVS